MSHTHACDVRDCRGQVPCCGDRVRDEDGLVNCEYDDQPEPRLCEDHAGWDMCDWCGEWHDKSLGAYCSEACRRDCEGYDLSDHEGAEADHHNKADKED